MTSIICVDLQNDFASSGGLCYQERPSVKFIKEEILPYLEDKDIKIAEIISDYRLPLIRAKKDKCVPGTRGYESLIPSSLIKSPVWVKALQSPCWIRENGGVPDKKPGIPFHKPNSFDEWLTEVGIQGQEDRKVILFGLTLDCCVLCLAQELHWRKFEVFILEEGTDTFFGLPEEKELRLSKNYFYRGKRISREETKLLLSTS